MAEDNRNGQKRQTPPTSESNPVKKSNTNGGPMDTFNTEFLRKLQSEDYRRLLDAFDKLRNTGLSQELPIPQIVVCGNVAPGKSSVLESITGIPFPSKCGLCTRFASRISMRRADTESIKIKIVPDPDCDNDLKQKLEAYEGHINDFTEFPRLIDEVTTQMGLNTPKEPDGEPKPRYSMHVLTIEMAGPDFPQLTLVDTPGVTSVGRDIQLSHQILDKFVRESRTIMLGVVSASVHYDSSGGMAKCNKVDLEGTRTLGIITKPDLSPDSETEQDWFNIARNKRLHCQLELGWHVLKNLSSEQPNRRFEARNLAESAFFKKGVWRDLPEADKGIESLRAKLAHIVGAHIRKELPTIRGELAVKRQAVYDAIEECGWPCETVSEQRKRVGLGLSKFHKLVMFAVHGMYSSDDFFTTGTAEDMRVRRLRATITHLNRQWSMQMKSHGCARQISQLNDPANQAPQVTANEHDQTGFAIDQDYAQASAMQEKITHEEAMEWVRQELESSTGYELGGDFNSDVILTLFRDLSKNWAQLAQEHVARVSKACSDFLYATMRHAAIGCPDVAINIIPIDPLLQRTEFANEQLSRLLKLRERPLVNYEPEFALVRANRRNVEEDAAQPQLAARLAAENALNCVMVYYERRAQHFIDAVATHVVEGDIVNEIEDLVLSPVAIHGMTDIEIIALASELPTTTQRRAALLKKLRALDDATDELLKMESTQDCSRSVQPFAPEIPTPIYVD